MFNHRCSELKKQPNSPITARTPLRKPRHIGQTEHDFGVRRSNIQRRFPWREDIALHDGSCTCPTIDSADARHDLEVAV